MAQDERIAEESHSESQGPSRKQFLHSFTAPLPRFPSHSLPTARGRWPPTTSLAVLEVRSFILSTDAKFLVIGIYLSLCKIVKFDSNST